MSLTYPHTIELSEGTVTVRDPRQLTNRVRRAAMLAHAEAVAAGHCQETAPHVAHDHVLLWAITDCTVPGFRRDIDWLLDLSANDSTALYTWSILESTETLLGREIPAASEDADPAPFDGSEAS